MSKAELKRKKAGLVCAKKLDDATEAMNNYLRACRECNDGSGDAQRGISDGRNVLIRDMSEYSSFLTSKYE